MCKVMFSYRSYKSYHSLPKDCQEDLLFWLEEQLGNHPNPKLMGKRVEGSLYEFCYFDFSGSMILAEWQSDRLVILDIIQKHSNIV